MKQITLLLVASLLLIACGDSPNKKLDKSSPANNVNNVDGNNTNNANNQNNQNNVNVNNENNIDGVSGPCIELADETVSFGIVLVGESLTIPVGITNCSVDTPLDIMVASAGEFMAEPISLGPMSRDDLPVTFTPPGEDEFIRDLNLNTSAGSVMIRLTGVGLDQGDNMATCPGPRISQPGSTQAEIRMEANVNTTVTLTGATSVTAYTITDYFWTIIARPNGSAATILESNGGRDVTFTPDMAGDYRIELIVLDTGGATECESATVDLEVYNTSDDVLRIELTWDTPSDVDQTDTNGTDMDIHYLHPSGEFNVETYDVFWRNQKMELSGDGVAELVLDDTDGQGPEVIEHRGATISQNYNIGVYYYNDFGFGASYATLRVFFNGVLMHEYRDQYLSTKGMFWKNTMVDPTTGVVNNAGSAIQPGF